MVARPSDLDPATGRTMATEATGETMQRGVEEVTGPASLQQVLDQFLTNAAIRNEQNIAIVRFVICGLLMAHVLAFRTVGTARWWWVLGDMAVACAFSAWQFGTIPRSRHVLGRLSLSVIFDAGVVFVGLLAWALWPEAGQVGVLRRVDAPIILMAMIGSGFRLSRRVAVTGAGLVGILSLVLVGIDYALNAEQIAYALPDLLVYGATGVGSALLGYFIAARTKQLIYEGADASVRAERGRQRLGVYVSEEVAAELLEDAELAMGGARQPVAVLFSDLRGFTKYAEKIPPERLVAELNDYLEVMVEVIRKEGGFIDKFIGDAIMAVFSVPAPKDQDAAHALRTAAAMQKALVRHNRKREKKGLPALAQGIGVHYGLGVVGNIGTRHHKAQFTVMGDVVNLASRLESATKEQGVPVLLSADLVERARAVHGDLDLPGVTHHGTLSVRGRDASLEVYALD